MLHDPNEEKLFPTLTGEALDVVRAEGEEVEFSPGDVLFSQGDQEYNFYVVLDGEIRITKKVGGDETVLAVHEPGGFTGEISMLTGAPAIATGRSIGKSRVIRVPPDRFRRLIAESPLVARVVLSAMARRASDVDAHLRQQEKMAALGKLSAGLAHELNNPAAAAARATDQLRESIRCLQALVLERERPFNGAELQVLSEVQKEALTRLKGDDQPQLDPLAQADLEDAITEWLEAKEVEEAWRMAPVLASAGIGPDRLEELSSRVSGDAGCILPWIEGVLNLAELLDQIENSTSRISELVSSIKQYSYMDQAPEQEIDLHEGLESTLKMLSFKLRKANVDVAREFDRTLPRVCAHGSELNQVWTNLIDNAIDAMKGSGGGRLTLRTSQDHGEAIVEVVDNGSGIPEDVQKHIFEPFYTTKEVGEGSGLGLDIARRIIKVRHKGEIKFESRPGETTFEVRLPIPCGGAVESAA